MCTDAKTRKRDGNVKMKVRTVSLYQPELTSSENSEHGSFVVVINKLR